MALETEAKIQVADHEAIRTQLITLGAHRQDEQLEVDTYFDTSENRLCNTNTALRLRRIGQKSVLTYKGPQEQSQYKKRQEIQVTVDNPQTMISLLKQLGFGQSLLFEKHRESWLLNQCRVELDTLPLLGTFVEVEGPSEQDITKTLEQLQLDKKNLIKTPYPTLLREHLQRTDNPNREIRLTNGS